MLHICRRHIAGVVLACAMLVFPGNSDALADVEFVRDQWGVPHLWAATDADSLYGLGYVTAEDRAFQMHYQLRVIQGRAAEVLGNRRKVRRKETAIESDRKMRTFGYYHVAQEVAENLDPDSRNLLQAYCDGVNAWFTEHAENLPSTFAEFGLEPEPWTPADCIAAWWHLAQFFGTDGTRDLMAEQPRRRMVPPAPGDESAAVVTRADASPAWLAELEAFQESRDQANVPDTSGEEGPKFSHAWVVGKEKSTTGSALLVSDPQTMVGNPALFYEFHVRGDTFNARGIGVPGSPVILIGFNEHVAWGMTALGADQADLFRLKTDPDRPNQYLFDGQWRKMEVVTETIRVKNGPPETLRVRWTHFGPVVTDYVFARPEDGEFALRRVPLCETDRETIQGALAMLRSRSAADFSETLEGWRFPSANVVFGDTQGNIGYWVAGALPLRSHLSPRAGRTPQDGSSSEHAWQGMLPHGLKPNLFNPKRGYVYSANHRPVGAFYQPYIGHSTGSMGDTLRSWRLRELFAEKNIFTPDDVLGIHYDQVNPSRRSIARLGYHLRDVQRTELSNEALQTLEHLEAWYQAGAPSDLRVPGAALAMEINTQFRVLNTELASVYGGGQTGLALFLRQANERLKTQPRAIVPAREQRYIDRLLADAWSAAVNRYGNDTRQWPKLAQAAVQGRRLGYHQSLDGFPSLDPRRDLTVPALYCVDGDTIHSQAAQAYTQFVTLHDVDQSRSLLPPGPAEDPESPWRTTASDAWAAGELHPAPLSRAAVERYLHSRKSYSAEVNDICPAVSALTGANFRGLLAAVSRVFFDGFAVLPVGGTTSQTRPRNSSARMMP